MATPQSNSDYYAVIFSHKLSGEDIEGYAKMNDHLVSISDDMPGYLGKETMKDEAGNGLSVLYWESLEAIDNWRMNDEHMAAKREGIANWYDSYRLRIAHVTYDKEFVKDSV
jgi:heme-degrading monooxygenase HmoA